MFAAGEVAGADSDAAVAASGELAGLEAAHALGLGDDASAERVTELTSSGWPSRPRPTSPSPRR